MKDYKAKELISKYHQGLASPEERRLVEQWFLIDLQKSTFVPDQEAFQKTDKRIKANLDKHIGENKPVRYKLWPHVAAIAAAVTAITLGIWLYNISNTPPHPDTPRHPELVSGSQDIAPGKNGATITLASGKIIQLSDAKSGVIVGQEIKYDDGTALIGRHPELISGSQLTASTAKGQTYQFTLPDGTKVWLNAASSLKFPSHFANVTERRVELSGEAYFEVFKNKKQPFIVKSKVQETEVLGTHFNISAYGNDFDAKTTLLEGSIRVKSYAIGNRVDQVILKPNQQASIHELALLVKDVDPETAVAWKDGFFKFNEERLDDIMQKVARWYNVEVVFAEPDLQWKTFNGTVSRFANISQLLKKLELTGSVHFKIEGRRIVVDR